MKNNVLKIVILYLLFAGVAFPAQAQEEAMTKETVVILHGIAKTSSSMKPIEQAFKEAGYNTLSITYPSTKMDLEHISSHLREKTLTEEFWENAGTVHFVTHSMGGLVARTYLSQYKHDNLGRVVMLAPPNKGSQVADLIHKLPPYKWYYGPAGDQLTTEVQGQVENEIYYDLGIIAGTKEWPYVVAAFVVPGKSDGRVSVENTKIAGMKDHVTVNGTHTFIMDKPEVHKQAISFIKTGAFER